MEGYGSWSLKSEALEKGLEPDECYVLRDAGASELERPDLAIEVVWTSGCLKELPIYQALGVPEVWTWVDGAITVRALGPDGYVQVERSALLPQIDLGALARCATITPQGSAVRAFLGRPGAAGETG